MITNDKIREILTAGENAFKMHDIDGKQDLKLYVYERVRALIAEAQQVKPLEFNPDEKLDYGYDLIAYTSYGHYGLQRQFGATTYALFINGKREHEPFSSVEFAVEIAQDIHKAKILRELVHNGSNN